VHHLYRRGAQLGKHSMPKTVTLARPARACWRNPRFASTRSSPCPSRRIARRYLDGRARHSHRRARHPLSQL